MLGTDLPLLKTAVPGPTSKSWIDRLSVRECPAITARRSRRAMTLGTASDDPIVWKQALGANVEDVDGNVFVDLTAGFGVASAGHRNPSVVRRLHEQGDTLLHAMGDAYPDPNRILLMEKLAEISGYERAILGCSGSDSVEAAIKTARMATGKSRILAFDQGYHGLAFGSLSSTDYKASSFRSPFSKQLGSYVDHAPFGGQIPEDLSSYGAVLVEPIQGRGGIRVPPDLWLSTLIEQAHQQGTLVIFDEIYTGFGRTGTWFAFQQRDLRQARPDMICIGKAMAGGFPISACLGTATVMDSWGASTGEAIHTQTFLGNPIGASMALGAIQSLEQLLPSVLEKEALFREKLQQRGFSVRGKGLLLGVELKEGLRVSREMLQRGFIVLPAGPNCEVLALTPPFVISEAQIDAFVEALAEAYQSIDI